MISILNIAEEILAHEDPIVSSVISALDRKTPAVSVSLTAAARFAVLAELRNERNYGVQRYLASRWDCVIRSRGVLQMHVSFGEGELRAHDARSASCSEFLTVDAVERLRGALEPTRIALRNLWVERLPALRFKEFSVALSTLTNVADRATLRHQLSVLSALPRWIFGRADRFMTLWMETLNLDEKGAAHEVQVRRIAREAIDASLPELACVFGLDTQTSGEL